VISKLLAAWRRAALTCAAAALCLAVAIRLIAGPAGAMVDVRWVSSLDAPARQMLEAQFQLEDGVQLDGSTWRYDLLDPSPDGIRALVGHPAVEDTHQIDRSRFSLEGAERTARRGRFAFGGTLVAIADGLAIALAAFGLLLTLPALRQDVSTSARWAPCRRRLRQAEHWLLSAEPSLHPYALLAILGVAVYAVALRYPPTDSDDLTYLERVVTVGNPLSYFLGENTVGGGYRPLLQLGLWLAYQLFGVWALPNQIVNLVLHLANAFLLYRIIHRAQPDKAMAWLSTAVFLISVYTVTTATWVSDRPMALTGLFVLLFVDYLSRHDGVPGRTAAAPIRISVVTTLSVLALLSKESGLVVPMVGLLFALWPANTALTGRERLRLAGVSTSIIALYLVVRMLLFGSDFASYSQDGYMFLGRLHYEHSADLPSLLRYINYTENVIKNAVAPVLPIFDEGGAVISGQSSSSMYLSIVVSTAVLFGLAVTQRISHLQRLALMVILANAAAHYVLFRIRLHYLSHAAFCLFVAASPLLGRTRGHDRRTLAAKAVSVIALTASILWASNMLSYQSGVRMNNLTALASGKRSGPVVEQVLQRYPR